MRSQQPVISNNITKDDEAAAMAAMFQAQTANWEETQEKMSQLVLPLGAFDLCSSAFSNEHSPCLFPFVCNSKTVPKGFIITHGEEPRLNVERNRFPPTRIDLYPQAMCVTDVERKVGKATQQFKYILLICFTIRTLDSRLPDE